MNEFTAILIILGFFVLRFGLPVLVVAAYSKALQQLYARW